jgi:predicted Zn-dependent protease
MAKASAQQVKNIKEQTKAVKEQTAIQKAGTLFDIQQTQIIAALKGDISAEERKRLELQLAILTGNTSEASKLAGELAKSQGLSQQLAAYLASLPDAKNPFTAWKSYLDMIEAQVRRIATGNPVAPVTSMAEGYGVTGEQYSLAHGSTQTSAAGVEFTVNVNAGTVIAEENLKDVIRDSLLNDSLQAKFAAIYRQGGSFGA